MQKISLFVILSIILSMPMAFGQEEALGAQKITLTSDNTAYQEGDVITITGTIEKVLPGMPVTLQIFFEKNLIQVSQVKVSQDGEFTDTFTAAGPQWQNEGTVIIKSDYGGASTELNIEFFKNTSGVFTSNYEVKIPAGGTFDVPYTMKGGIVSSMNLNQKNLSLVINVATSSDGNLNINLPRDGIDSVDNNGQDIDFIVLMYEGNSEIPIQTDVKKIEAEEKFRSIDIPVKDGDTKIEIVGTHVVPEFGTIAMIVLAVAIISIIAVSAKSRLSIMPRI
jgi:predicted secreted protein with PEFG-CTERM motif